MPTALSQGGESRSALRADAKTWGGQLNAAGVNLNLAPVMDTVPASLGTGNKPIGYYYREFGHHPKVVAGHGKGFSRGMEAAKVQTTAKHFPGLGRVWHNTDTNPHVTDKVTTRHDSYLRPFQAAVDSGISVVMVSSARYAKIDPDHIAAFSPTVMTGMLRHDLGFTGVIMSDDLGAAAAVQDLSPATRAVRFLRAGGTVVLSVAGSLVSTMAAAVVSRAKVSDRFRAKVSAAALHVLRAKNHAGLLPCS